MAFTSSLPKIDLPFSMEMAINFYIESKLTEGKMPIKIISLISTDLFVHLLEENMMKFDDVNFDYTTIEETETASLTRFHMKRKLPVNELEDTFFVYQNGNIVFIITCADKLFINSGIFYIAKKMYPRVIISYITSEDIENILELFESSKKQDLFYRNAVRKKLFGKKETDIKYKYGPYKEAFNEARLNGLWIDRIEISSKDETYHFELSRDGVVKILRGFFRDYFLIFRYISYKYKDKFDFFSNRSREYMPDYSVRPIKLPFYSSIFYEKTIREQFVEVIGKYPHCNYSVNYIGNPHFHVNIFDKLDYSVFTVKSYSSDSIIITPQISTTEAALMRFTKHLLDNFRETDFVNFDGD